jgi:anti-anti-sigma regulatory factor
VSFSLIPSNEHLVLQLHGAVTIYDAQELATQLREVASSGTPIEVQTKELVEIDTCMLQLLYALRSSLPNVTFDDPPEAFLAAAEMVGLRREILSVREEL